MRWCCHVCRKLRQRPAVSLVEVVAGSGGGEGRILYMTAGAPERYHFGTTRYQQQYKVHRPSEGFPETKRAESQRLALSVQSLFLEAPDIIHDSGNSGFNFCLGIRVLFFDLKHLTPVWHIPSALGPSRPAAAVDYFAHLLRRESSAIGLA